MECFGYWKSINFVQFKSINSRETLINNSFGYNKFNISISCLAIDKIIIFAESFIFSGKEKIKNTTY